MGHTERSREALKILSSSPNLYDIDDISSFVAPDNAQAVSESSNMELQPGGVASDQAIDADDIESTKFLKHINKMVSEHEQNRPSANATEYTKLTKLRKLNDDKTFEQAIELRKRRERTTKIIGRAAVSELIGGTVGVITTAVAAWEYGAGKIIEGETYGIISALAIIGAIVGSDVKEHYKKKLNK